MNFISISWKERSPFYVGNGIFFVFFFIHTKENRALLEFQFNLQVKKVSKMSKVFLHYFLEFPFKKHLEFGMKNERTFPYFKHLFKATFVKKGVKIL